MIRKIFEIIGVSILIGLAIAVFYWLLVFMMCW